MPEFSPLRFVGRWQLDPARSQFQLGWPPRSGQYTIVFDGKQLHYLIEWTGDDGQSHNQVVVLKPDGQEHTLSDTPGFADTIRHTLLSDTVLESTARSQGVAVGSTRTELVEEGNTLLITQSGPLPEGGTFTNISVYHRVG